MKIADLFARIGVKADTGKLESFKKSLGNVGKLLGVTTIAAGGVAVALQKITRDAMDSAAAFKQFESETGASSAELQKWQSVAEQTNNSGQELAAGIKAIAANREALRLGKGSIGGYQLLGIDPNQDPFEILTQLRSKIGELPAAMQKNVIAQMGLSANMLQVLNLSNEQFDDMANRAFIVPQSAIDSLDKARGGLAVMSDAFRYIKTLIGAGLTPNVEKMSKAFGDFVKRNQNRIVAMAKTMAEWIGKFGNAVFNVVKMLDSFVQKTIGWKGALLALAGVFVALNASVMVPVAALILLIAIFDDIYRFTQGKDSLLGRLFEKFPQFEAIIMGIARPIKEIFLAIQAIANQDMATFDAIIEKWGYIGVVVDFWRDRIVALKGAIKDLFDLNLESGLDKMAEGFGGVFSLIAGVEDIATGEGSFMDILKSRGSQAFNQSAAGKLVEGAKTVIDGIVINIDGSGNPEATGNAVVNAFNNFIGRTADQTGGVE